MRKSTNVYYFMMNYETTLGEGSSIIIEFLENEWQLHSAFAVHGFSDPDNATF